MIDLGRELSEDAARLLAMLALAEECGRRLNIRDFDPPWDRERAEAACRELIAAGFAEPGTT